MGQTELRIEIMQPKGNRETTIAEDMNRLIKRILVRKRRADRKTVNLDEELIRIKMRHTRASRKKRAV